MRRTIWFALLLTVLPARMVAGQSATATIRGTITDATGAGVSGAHLTLFGSDSGIQRQTVTAGDGSFLLSRLLTGHYTLTVIHDGFDTVDIRGLALQHRDELVLKVQLRLRPLAEHVTVVPERAFVRDGFGERFSVAGGLVEAIRISGESQRTLPLSARRDWADFLWLTPGVVAGLDAGGLPRYHWHGSDTTSHVLRIDGADMGSSIGSDTAYINLSPEAMERIELTPAAQDAAAPLGFGAIIDVSTRSGLNRPSATVAALYQPRGWNAQNVPGGTSQSVAFGHEEFSAGTPLGRSAWMFGAAHVTRRQTGISRRSDQLALLNALEPRFEPFDNRSRDAAVFVKAVARPIRGHVLSGFTTYDRRPEGANHPLYAGPFANRIFGGHGAALRLASQWSARGSTELAASYNDKSAPIEAVHDDRPSRPVHRSVYRTATDIQGTGAIAILDNVSSDVDRPRQKLTVTIDAAYHSDHGPGSHALRAGLYLQPNMRDELRHRFVNGGFVLEEMVLRNATIPGAGMLPFHRRRILSRTPATATVESSDYAFYVHDAWSVTPHVTIDAGVRADLIRRRDGPVDASTQRYLDVQALNRRGVMPTPPAADHALFQSTLALGPRLSVAFATGAENRHVVRAGWGRVHEALSATVPLVTVDQALIVDEYDVNLDGRFERSIVNRSLSPPTAALVANRHRRQPHADEWRVAYQWQPSAAVALHASFHRRSFRDRLTAVDINSRYTNGQFVGYDDPLFSEVWRVDNNVWNWPVYSAVGMQAQARRGNLFAAGTYTRQWRHIEGGWQINDPAGILQPLAFDNDRGLGPVSAVSTFDGNSLSGVNMTAGSQWRDHVFRLTAHWLLPAHFSVAAAYTFQSGPWSGPIVARIGSEAVSHPALVVLRGNRVAANPLATSLRFDHPTRGAGQIALPAMQALNLRLARQIMRRPIAADLALDLFNLTNHDADLDFEPGANQVFGPNYGKGTARQSPRAAQVLIRMTF